MPFWLKEYTTPKEYSETSSGKERKLWSLNFVTRKWVGAIMVFLDAKRIPKKANRAVLFLGFVDDGPYIKVL